MVKCRQEPKITTNGPMKYKLDRFLTGNLIAGDQYRQKRYLPLQTFGLFEQFAGTETTEKGILRFANEYGLLTKGVGIELPDRKAPSASESPIGVGERLRLWQTEIPVMRRAVKLWRMLIPKPDRERLAQVIRWGQEKETSNYTAVSYFIDGSSDTIASINFAPDLFERFEPGDVVRPARHYLQRIVNVKLSTHISPQLLWEKEDGSRGRNLGLYFCPQNLLAAIWLQFALAIENGEKVIRCGYCGMPFLIGVGAKRRDSQYCKTSHRQMALRNRPRARTATYPLCDNSRDSDGKSGETERNRESG